MLWHHRSDSLFCLGKSGIMHRTLVSGGTIVLLSLIAGCGSSSQLPATLKPQSFQPTATATPTQGSSGNATQAAKPPTPVADDSQTQISAAIPATRPTTRPAKGESSGTYMYIGTVVAEVNGQPIYADKVLAKVDTELSVKAPLLEPEAFRAAARNAILKQIEYDKQLELQYAAAQRNTTEEEKQRAYMLAGMWRDKEIQKAGGSVAVARRVSLDKDGIDFEEKVKEQYQAYMILIYFQSKISPRVQVSGDDMRHYYEVNISQFTEKAGVRFRAIKVGVKESGSREKALDEAQRILERARRGEDFEKLSQERNDDKIRQGNQGWWLMEEVKGDDGQTIGKQPRWVEPGSLRLEQVEKAAFAMQVTDVSSAPVDVGDGFYILKLEAKQNGRVRGFDEPDVQSEIRRVLTADQTRVLRQRESEKLVRQSVVRLDEKKIETTVDMAMQKYFAWSRANGLTRANQDQVQGTSR